VKTFYGEEARGWQQRFLDHFLKDVDNGTDRVPKVRLEVRRGFYRQEVRPEEARPLPLSVPVPLHLCAKSGDLHGAPVRPEGTMRYRSTSRTDRAAFFVPFADQVESIGRMRLKLWGSTIDGDGLDLFVLLRKLDPDGREVFFCGSNGFERDGLAKGWLRASHRPLDLARSTSLRPRHCPTEVQKIGSREAVPVEIEIWPPTTVLESMSGLLLTVQRHDAARYPAFAHRPLVNQGWHTVLDGGSHDSCPIVPSNRRELAATVPGCR
jgi:predicted acyl esterase